MSIKNLVIYICYLLGTLHDMCGKINKHVQHCLFFLVLATFIVNRCIHATVFFGNESGNNNLERFHDPKFAHNVEIY